MKTSSLVAQVGFIAAAAASVWFFVRSAQNDQRRGSCNALCALGPAYAGRDRIAPDFELPDLDGRPMKLSSYRGKTVVLNFWTKTCNPCLEEMPSLAELGRVANARNDFVLLTVSTDEDPREIRDALKIALGSNDLPFPVMVDGESSVVSGKYGTHLFPETWIIDPRGVIRARFDGARDWSLPIAVELTEKVGKPANACPVEFFKGQPRGPFAGLCEDES